MAKKTIQRFVEDDARIFPRRILVASFAVGLLTVLLIARIAYLQVYQFDYYTTRAIDNQIQQVPIAPSRGRIFDVSGQIMASQTTYFDLKYYPEKASMSEANVIAFLERTIGLTHREKRLIEQSDKRTKLAGIVVRPKISEVEIAKIAAHSFLESGLEIHKRLYRAYPEKEAIAHITGYIGKISEKDQSTIEDADKEHAYLGIDIIGKAGLEHQYEEALRGVPGSQQVEVSARGVTVRVLNQTLPNSGTDLITSIDLDVQKKAFEVFKDKVGALVALDPNNGQVIALLSQSSFDPNLFIGENDKEVGRLIVNPDRPLLNRAIAGVYPPASTFKSFVGLAGLELGKRKVTDTIFDPGYFTLPGSTHRYRDWKPSGHGVVDFKKSLVESVDTYYYGLAVQLGIDNLSHYLAQFDFGKRTGIDLPGERAGLLPSTTWKKNRFKTPWITGDTVSVGVGQGYILMTPLQVASAYATIANKGFIYTPRLVKALKDPLTGSITELPVPAPRTVTMSNEHHRALVEALDDVTNPGGTAARAFIGAPYTTAGKTGTAQVVAIAQDKKYNAKELKREFHDHAWFVGFAPVDNPKIVVAALVENGGGGSATAAPIVRQVMDVFFKKQEKNESSKNASAPTIEAIANPNQTITRSPQNP